MLALKTTCYGATDILGNNLSINTNFILRTLNFIYEKLGENRNSATWESINHIHRIQNHQLLMISKMKKNTLYKIDSQLYVAEERLINMKIY